MSRQIIKLYHAGLDWLRPEIADFNKAVRQFAQDLPAVLDALRTIIVRKRVDSPAFAAEEIAFLRHARTAIDAAVSPDDVQEMLIQHILTADLFATVFDDTDFHRSNNVATELCKLEDKLFGHGEKQGLLHALGPYYAGIGRTAAVIQSHSEKQAFLKGLYENFYKLYNAGAADRLGVVYTPGEIVRFMIRSADTLCEQHFGKNLIDRGVEILDPATGTGTFIVELLEHFRGDHAQLTRKYPEELHANEIAILPCHVAHLNIAATYQAITGQFAEFPNLRLVDTLDIPTGPPSNLPGSPAHENRRKISVIIGNPPYNANQQSENDDNRNRAYPHIDKRIKDTYIKLSKARKTKLYDPYARFFRWASDRLGDEGIVAFVTNRSFLDALGFDGFRLSVAADFVEGWILDLGGDLKRKDVAGGGNVFGIGTGVAVSFWVRRRNAKQESRIRYKSVPAIDAERKLSLLSGIDLDAGWIDLPAGKADWLGLPTAATDHMLPLVDSKTRAATHSSQERSIFRLYSLGVSTNRDDWLYDRSADNLAEKVAYLADVYDGLVAQPETYPNDIKWSRNLKRRLAQRRHEKIDASLIVDAEYRPFTRKFLYRSPLFVDELGQALTCFPRDRENMAIGFTRGRRGSFSCLATARTPALDWFIPDACQYQPRYRYDKDGERIDNITDWALNKFVARYGRKDISKDAIFHYVYAVLHDPVYLETFALNLKREFPRIPFYPDFAQWAFWGEALMAMHVGYETVEPWPVQRVQTPGKKADGPHPKAVLRSSPERGIVAVDTDTQITDIPPEAWGYRLGHRSAIDWVLDQHKEKRPRDPTVAARFNAYRFADYKESMIDLLARVVRISIDTLAITGAMRDLDRMSWGTENEQP
ncbi:MAG: methyltransferase [Sphingomonas bacterium]|nr:methyltransferase [Sphingomonas bacterium]